MIPLCKQNKSGKIFETTNEEYNIRIRVYKHRRVIKVMLYTNSLAKQINSGQQNILIAQLGSENGPFESFTQMITSSNGQRFNIECNSNGNISIAYVYSNIPTPNQITQTITYITK